MARRDQGWKVSFDAHDSFRDRQGLNGHGQPRRTPSGPPCPSLCNSRWRQLVKEPLDAFEKAVKAWQEDPAGMPPEEPEVPGLRPWLGDPVLCPPCQSRLHAELAELGDLADIADMENTGHRKGPDAERVGGSRHAPSPSPVADDLDELASILRSWEAVARGEDESAARAGYLMSEIGTVVARLGGRHFARLTSDPAATPEFAREVHQWHRHFKDKVTRTGTGRRQMRRPCPRCERFSLVEEDGAEYISCQTPTCQRLLSREEYRALDEALGKARPGAA